MRFLSLLCLMLAACAPQSEPVAQDWMLKDAPELAGDRHIIITVELDDRAGLTAEAERIERDYGVVLAAEWPLNSIEVHCFVFEVPVDAPMETVIAQMEDDPEIRTVQPMQSFVTALDPYEDDLFQLQTGLQQIQASEVHRIATGRNVVIGVIDTAVDFAHPDLAGQRHSVKDFVSTEVAFAAAEEHGTAIAGVIAADGSNATGIVGVAPGARLMGLRGCWETEEGRGRCSSFSIARALNYAILNGVDVLNMSLAGPPDPLLEEILVAAMSQGVVIVAAEGRSAETGFPASLEGVIAVGAPDARARDGTLPAPGVDVLSTAPGRAFDFYSGSSIAAAHISGVAALILEHRPDIDPQSLAIALAQGAAAVATSEGPLVFDSCAALAAAGVPGGGC